MCELSYFIPCSKHAKKRTKQNSEQNAQPVHASIDMYANVHPSHTLVHMNS